MSAHFQYICECATIRKYSAKKQAAPVICWLPLFFFLPRCPTGVVQ